MATPTDQTEFDRDVATARARHQEAIKAATSAFDAACKQAQVDWQAKLAKAKADFDQVRSDPEPGELVLRLRAEFDRARTSSPDIEPARRQLAEEVGAADRELNEALVEARRRLREAPSVTERSVA